MIPRSSLDKTLIDRVIDLLKSQQQFNFFKKFYYGDPYQIPTSYMPCVAVELLRTQIEAGATGMDRVTQTVLIKLIYDKSADYNSNDTSEVTGVRTMETLAQGIDPASSEYEGHTVASILRKNFTLANFATNQTMDIQYGIYPRNAGPTSECHITFVVEDNKVVSGRI
jgi:hypothetical protein